MSRVQRRIFAQRMSSLAGSAAPMAGSGQIGCGIQVLSPFVGSVGSHSTCFTSGIAVEGME